MLQFWKSFNKLMKSGRLNKVVKVCVYAEETKTSKVSSRKIAV